MTARRLAFNRFDELRGMSKTAVQSFEEFRKLPEYEELLTRCEKELQQDRADDLGTLTKPRLELVSP